MKQKFLITGITGFAGPHLANLLLEKGHEVHGIVRTANGRETDLLDVIPHHNLKEIKFHYLDLKHYYSVDKLLKAEKFDGVFHLAAQSHPPTSFSDPILTWEENVSSTVNLITSLQGTNTRFMFCSTSEVYGDTCKDIGLLKVSNPLSPSNPYGTSKAAMDLYVQERSSNGFLDGFVTRAFSHTGPRRGKIFSISSDAAQIAAMELGLQDKILNIGNLQTERVVIDVRDCVNAYYLLMMTPKSRGKAFNVCGNEVRKMQYYTDLLIDHSKLDYNEVIQQIYKPYYRDIDIQVQVGDSSELVDITGWEPKIKISQTMEDLLDYWRKKLEIK
jgi:GDPmannose 4,6-dehydratase